MKSRSKRIKGHGPEFTLYRKVERAIIQAEFKQLDLVDLFSREMKSIDTLLACRSKRVLDDAKRTTKKKQKQSFSFFSCFSGTNQIYPESIPLETDYLDQLRNQLNILDKNFTSTDTPITKDFLCDKIDEIEEIGDDLLDLSTYKNLNKEPILIFLRSLIRDAQKRIQNYQETPRPSIASTVSTSDVSPRVITPPSLSLSAG